MVYKNFRIAIIGRILLLTACIFIFLLSLTKNYYTAFIILGLTIIAQIISFYKYVDQTNRKLASFLESIRFSEFTRSFQTRGMGKSFQELNEAFNNVIKDFQAIRAEREEQYHYLQSIVQNLDVSIIAYQRNGHVEMVNKTFNKLFQINSLRNINELSHISDELATTFINLKPGENYLVRVQDEEDILQLAIYGTEFKIKDKSIFLVTIKNIQNVLEDQETEAWQKLIRVLTHEIMNSITPIASLSATLNNSLLHKVNKSKGKPEIDQEELIDFQQALQTIHKRSSGLLHFVDTYRNLTRIPKPIFKIVKLKSIFENICPLFEDEMGLKKIKFNVVTKPEDIEISCDGQLMEQVFINLLQNAIQALINNQEPEIILSAFYNKRGRVTVQVKDNGEGILPEVVDKIFIPFFTTKQKGSGIGLSLSRQIMKLHGGTITVKSELGKGTVFTLSF